VWRCLHDDTLHLVVLTVHRFVSDRQIDSGQTNIYRASMALCGKINSAEMSRSYWAYSQLRHSARSCYENEAITTNNTVNKQGSIVVFAIKPIRTGLT